MKRLILTLAVLAAPGLAFAQTATTASDPDKPVASEWAVTTPTGEPIAGAASALWLDEDQRVAAAEETLREVIASAQAGEFDHPDMSAGTRASFEPQNATLVPIVQGFGAMGEIHHIGLENGAERFHVAFENAQTEWVIGFNDDGKIGILLFKPAETEDVAAAPEPAAE